MFTHNRPSTDLNGTWKFSPDPYQRCRQQQWWKGEGPDDRFFPCFNMDGLWDIQVPGTWKMQHPELAWYDGHAVYAKDFALTLLEQDADVYEAFLCFDSVVYAAEVYLNGVYVGAHDWGYSPFQFRVTGLLRKGTNRLFVLVENELSEDRVPGIRYDWNNDGGIIGGVKIVYTPTTYVENFRTSTRLDDDQAVITVDISIESRNRDATERVTVSIAELDLEASTVAVVAAPVESPARVEMRVPREGIRLWSPETPQVYRTVVSTRHEDLVDEIGFREVRTVGPDILLNGEPIRLYGVATHSEFPGTGRTATEEGVAQLVARAKELGANFVRCAHYPFQDMFARAMDRAGLLWWEEVPVYWLHNIHLPRMKRLALGMLEETIRRDWNRSSLVIWSLSNECAGPANFSKEIGLNYPYWHEAAGLVRRLDPSRLVSSADSGFRRGLSASWTPERGDAFDATTEDDTWIAGHPDDFYALFDVLGANHYVSSPGEGRVAYRKLERMLAPFNKPIVLTEFGSMSVENVDCPEDVIGHPARHERILREAYDTFSETPRITGYVPWCLMDIRVPMHWRWYNRGQGVFRYGLMDETWTPKRAFRVVREEIARLKERFGGAGGLDDG